MHGAGSQEEVTRGSDLRSGTRHCLSVDRTTYPDSSDIMRTSPSSRDVMITRAPSRLLNYLAPAVRLINKASQTRSGMLAMAGDRPSDAVASEAASGDKLMTTLFVCESRPPQAIGEPPWPPREAEFGFGSSLPMAHRVRRLEAVPGHPGGPPGTSGAPTTARIRPPQGV